MIKVGPAGSGGLGNLKGVARVAAGGLDCMEVEFTYGVRMGLEAAGQVGALARDKKILLSVHAPYYINLAAGDRQKYEASCRRILDSCQRAHAMGARSVVFHAGFYQKNSAEETYRRVKAAILELKAIIKRRRWRVELCPETTGKPSQFGSLEELLRLRQETGCGLTVDFAHLFARQQGKIDYGQVIEKLPARFHAHFSGIQYGDKGERKHVNTTRRFFEPLAVQLLRHDPDVTLINESPRPYEDALMMKRTLQALQAGRRR